MLRGGCLVFGCVAMLAACGRVGFDPSSERVADAPDGLPDTPILDAIGGGQLVAHFPFDDDPSDGVENFALGNGTAMCVTTCPTLVPGIRGSAYRFNGTTDAIRYPDIPALHTQSGTMTMWIRLAQLPALDQYTVFLGKPFQGAVENTWEMYLLRRPAGIDLYGGGDSGNNDIYAIAPWTVAVDTWAHVALTWGSRLRLYVGGVMVAEQADPGRSYDGSDVYIGADYDTGTVTANVNGSIDSVFLFSGELSAAEIAQLATP